MGKRIHIFANSVSGPEFDWKIEGPVVAVLQEFQNGMFYRIHELLDLSDAEKIVVYTREYAYRFSYLTPLPNPTPYLNELRRKSGIEIEGESSQILPSMPIENIPPIPRCKPPQIKEEEP